MVSIPAFNMIASSKISVKFPLYNKSRDNYTVLLKILLDSFITIFVYKNVCYYFFVSTLFSKIINQEIPSFKVAEDESLRFLDIRPISPGHTLVIQSMKLIIYDMSDESLSKILIFFKQS